MAGKMENGINQIQRIPEIVEIRKLLIIGTDTFISLAATRLFFSRLFQNSRENSRDFCKTNTLYYIYYINPYPGREFRKESLTRKT